MIGCIGYKWIFALLGSMVAGSRGFWIGFIFGWIVDSMFNRNRVHFTFHTFDPFEGQDTYQRHYEPYRPQVNTRLLDAYRTLGIEETASDDEVRQAYRRLALRYHPDRVASQGEQERQAAERIFQQIGEAKDIIFKARGMK